MTTQYSRRFRYTIGITALSTVAICWGLEAESLQGLQQVGSENFYDKVSGKSSLFQKQLYQSLTRFILSISHILRAT
jgi:hypothetical protein